MSRTYDVIRSGVAENDLKEVIEYIATDSPTNALKTLRQEASSLYAFLNEAI